MGFYFYCVNINVILARVTYHIMTGVGIAQVTHMPCILPAVITKGSQVAHSSHTRNGVDMAAMNVMCLGAMVSTRNCHNN